MRTADAKTSEERLKLGFFPCDRGANDLDFGTLSGFSPRHFDHFDH
jgi:hypothetical protein